MGKTFTPLERRLGGIVTGSRRDATRHAALMQRAWAEAFLAGHACALCPPTDIPEDLPQAERLRRAKALRQAHFIRMRIKSSARGRKAA